MITPKCNEEIWRGDILNTSRRSNDIVLQKIHMHTVKAACAMTDACDKIMKMNLKSDQCREMITPVIDALALLGVVTAEINQFRREQMKDRLPAKMQPLTKNVPPESEWLFGNDLSKRFNQLNSTNTALIKTSISSYSGKNTRYHLNNHHHQGHQHMQPTLQKTCSLPGGALLKGRDGSNSRATDSPETKFSK